MKKWRTTKFWLPVFILCLFGLIVKYQVENVTVKQVAKQPTLISPHLYEYLDKQPKSFKEKKEESKKPSDMRPIQPPVVQVLSKPDYAGIGLKVGSGIGGLMSLMNFIEKILKWIRRKKNGKETES